MMPVGQRYEFPDWFQLGLQKRTYNHRGDNQRWVSHRWGGGRMNWICLRIGAGTQQGTQRVLNTPHFALTAVLGHL
jgi:hypothetical protein